MSIASGVPPPLVNLRDLGGHAVAGGGRVRAGLVYRSADLGRLDAAGVAAVADLGIRTVYDLRTAAEREGRPDRLPRGSRYVVVDVLETSTDWSPAELMEVLRDPVTAASVLGDGGAARMWARMYRELVEMDGARRAYGRLFRDLSTVGHRPALVHCTTGKDRTGWAAAALLLLLGVPERAVIDEYLLSAGALARAFEPELEAFRALGGDPELLRPMIAVHREYLAASLDAMRHRFGTVEAYFADGLGVDAATRGALREAFLEPALAGPRQAS